MKEWGTMLQLRDTIALLNNMIDKRMCQKGIITNLEPIIMKSRQLIPNNLLGISRCPNHNASNFYLE